MKPTFTQEELKEYLEYYPDLGIFVWIKNPGYRGYHAHRLGKVADSYNSHKKRYVVGFKGYTWELHQLAYFYMTGIWSTRKMQVDHIDRDKLNNKWDNLRLVTPTVNINNRSYEPDFTFGEKVRRAADIIQSIQTKVSPDQKSWVLERFC